ncbi:hypothetical protein [Curtobacterium sp. MCPF17_052]|uniref:hypothetical protein n=1 Tax=Curtobacterium sp. MCPF17_052 TaxID=2175655 RepID=UPI0024DFD156|nr:hypothetical protein [Curtobacterium sp. MCPF17_052]WIB14056.1 hypothetical protein DEJ36_09895 [Curtobacterium sp. MCPF17_052]
MPGRWRSTRPPGNDAATALIGTQANAPIVGGGAPRSPAGPEDDTEEKKSRAWIWWLVGAVVLIAAIVIGVLVFANGDPDPKPSQTQSSAPRPTRSQTPSQEPSATPSDTRTTINPADYVGRATDQVQTELQSMGFAVQVQDGDPAENAEQANTVQSISPTGSLSDGALITLREFTAPPSVNKPNTPSAGAVSATGAVTFSWSTATCPTGYTVSKYSWTVSGGKDSSGATSGDTSETSVDIQADQAGDDVTLSYTVTCGNLAASSSSDPATATWVAPVEPTDAPTSTATPQD